MLWLVGKLTIPLLTFSRNSVASINHRHLYRRNFDSGLGSHLLCSSPSSSFSFKTSASVSFSSTQSSPMNSFFNNNSVSDVSSGLSSSSELSAMCLYLTSFQAWKVGSRELNHKQMGGVRKRSDWRRACLVPRLFFATREKLCGENGLGTRLSQCNARATKIM